MRGRSVSIHLFRGTEFEGEVSREVAKPRSGEIL